MSLLGNVNEKVVLVRALLTALRAAERIVRRVVKLFVRAVHGEIFEDHFAMKAFEKTFDLPFIDLRLLIDGSEISVLVFAIGRLLLALPFRTRKRVVMRVSSET